MHHSMTIIIGALTLGFVGGAIPGPVLTTIFTEIVETSFLRSLRVLFWAMLIETLVRTSALLLVGTLPLDGAAFQLLSLIGAAVLIRIAFKVWSMKIIRQGDSPSFNAKTLAFMIICNGMLWTYWLTACVPDAMVLGQQVLFGQYIYLVFFEIGWLISTFLVACIFSFFKPLLSHPKVIPFLFKFFSFVFVVFALKMITGSIQYFI